MSFLGHRSLEIKVLFYALGVSRSLILRETTPISLLLGLPLGPHRAHL